jgi:hypothetical protein
MKTNLQFFLNSYNDLSPTTTPSQNNFKWLREINGIPFNVENSQQIQVPTLVTTANLLPLSFLELSASSVGNINGTTALTLTGATAGIVPGLLIVGAGIPANTTVVSIAGTAVVMSNPATTTTVGVSLTFYLPASFIYMESDQQVSVIYNGGTAMVLNPFQVNGLIQPAVFFIAGAITSITVTNPGTATANVFFASMG